MKKALLVSLIVALLFSLVACKTADVEQELVAEVVEEPVAEEPDEQITPVDLDIKGLAGANVPGVLYQLEDGEPVIRGISLCGNRAYMELTEPATDNIRFVFELSEWVSIFVDTDQNEGISVRVVKHEDDSSVYVEAYFDEAEIYAYCEINKPEEAEECWGDFNVSADEQTGFYDLVFVDNEDNKPLALIILDFFKETELEKYSETQLSQIMAEIIASGEK